MVPEPSMRQNGRRVYRAILDHWALLSIWGLGTLTWTLFTFVCTSDDCWFYNVITRNIVLYRQQSFSGIFPTNGVHPLWLYLLTGYSYVVAQVDASWLKRDAYAVPLSAAFALWGAWNLSRVADKLGLPRLLVAGMPLVFVMGFGMLYSEAHVFLAVLAWLIRVTVERQIEGDRQDVLTGFLVALVFLARLDAMFFACAYGLWYLASARRLRSAAGFATSALLLVVPYLVANWALFGSAMPISGWMKSTFPNVSVRGIYWAGLSSTLCGYNMCFGVLPILVALVVLMKARRFSSETNHFFWVLWIGAAAQFAYIALFTRSHTGWYWYYVLPVVLGGLGAGIGWRELGPSPLGRSGRAIWASRGSALASILLVMAFAAVMVKGRWGRGMERSPETRRTLDFIRRHDLHNRAMLVSDWPGYPAFKSDNYVVAADMLTINRPLYNELKASPDALQFLLEYCRKHGRPVEYVIYSGNRWLVPNQDLRDIVLYDPHHYPALRPIGRMRFPRPPSEVIREGGQTKFAVWQLPD
jgi:hypothetical protein